MSKKFISFYFVLAVAVYIFSIALFIKNTVYEYKDGSKTCITLSNTIKNDFSTKGMAKAVKALDSNPDVAAFTVKKNGLSVAGRNENFNFEETSRFIHSDIWTLSDEENTTVSIALFKLKPAAIFNNAKTSFLIILACTLLTMLLLILDPVFSPAKKENYSTVDESVNPEDEEINTEEADITENSTEDFGSSAAEEEEEEDISLPDSEPEVDRIEEPAHEPAENTETSLTQAEATAENNQNPEKQEDFDIEIFPQDDSVKIESLEEESPLSEKINSILSDNKAEVSLFLLCYVGTEKDEEITEHVKSFIQDAYFPEDAIFTLNGNTLALVKADTDIDQAEDFAADFHKALTEQVLSEKSGIQFDIGISSRATRTITAARLITEAKEALKHAISDNESHIIGFHVDIEKYNEFMKNRKQSN